MDASLEVKFHKIIANDSIAGMTYYTVDLVNHGLDATIILTCSFFACAHPGNLNVTAFPKQKFSQRNATPNTVPKVNANKWANDMNAWLPKAAEVTGPVLSVNKQGGPLTKIMRPPVAVAP